MKFLLGINTRFVGDNTNKGVTIRKILELLIFAFVGVITNKLRDAFAPLNAVIAEDHLQK